MKYWFFKFLLCDFINPSLHYFPAGTEPFILPAMIGAQVPQANYAELSTTGFDLSLECRNVISSDFRYGVRFTLGNYKSIVTKYNNPTKSLNTWREGQEQDEIWGYSVEGLFQSESEIADHADQSFIFQ